MDVYLAGVGNLKSCIQNGLVSVKGVRFWSLFMIVVAISGYPSKYQRLVNFYLTVARLRF